MSNTGPGDVLVAVEDPAQVAQLVRTAGDLARARDGRVRLITVVVKPPNSPFGMFSDETIIEEFAADSHKLLESAPDIEDVAIVRDLVVARNVSDGIVSAVKNTSPSALLIGWDSDPSRSDALLGTTVDSVFARAPTDVYAERMGREAGEVTSILVPVAGGPHVDATVTGAGAIAAGNDASVTVLSVGAEETDRNEARAFAEASAATLTDRFGTSITVETAVRTGEHVEDEIVAAAEGHDVIMLGATRQGVLRGRLVGSVPRRVVRDTDQTVIVARGKGGTSGRLARLVSRIGRSGL